MVKIDETTAVGHISKGGTGRFSKAILYFFQVKRNSRRVEISDFKAMMDWNESSMHVAFPWSK